ncbi:AraC family transcriptional regulator [Aquimarina sp. 2201CG5-10]|uniref:AraC family transcriptional regulator n=1 Tax=Aquimarina callyspongiae TaxID=3098150 RepID=UPI002AB37083|nr:AraC family transcriptional regulator [Aquimarina sp. 2201CG5-10]MDY8137205.1 AraC family transcriptional regulator [Aquimarina sp. 2201CG5-10]
MLTIHEHKPKLFSDLIERIWIAENNEQPIKIVTPPNQYVNLIIPIGNSIYKRNQVWIHSPCIEGVSSTNTMLTYPAGTKLIGIRFFAFGLFPFLQIEGKNIINTSFEFTKANEAFRYSNTDSNIDLIHKTYELLNTLFSEKSYKSIYQIRDFYNEFRWNDNVCSIEAYCKTIKTNYSTLNRNFTRIIGISPKKFERLIKFRKSLCSLIFTSGNLTSVALESGYFDQAHFIREFKKFINHTPSDYQSLIKQGINKSEVINYNFQLL